jgi:hypothetical protein
MWQAFQLLADGVQLEELEESLRRKIPDAKLKKSETELSGRLRRDGEAAPSDNGPDTRIALAEGQRNVKT